MAISPQEALLPSEQERAWVVQAEREIDTHLKQTFTELSLDLPEVPKVLTLRGGRGIRAKVLDEMAQRYREAGWNFAWRRGLRAIDRDHVHTVDVIIVTISHGGDDGG